MAMSLRLPHTLAERGRRYAAESGISLNGLLAVALREYLDARTRGRANRTRHRCRERKRWRKQWRGKSWPVQYDGAGELK